MHKLISFFNKMYRYSLGCMLVLFSLLFSVLSFFKKKLG